MRLPLVLLLAGSALLAAGSANALNSITNLDDQPHGVTIESIGGGQRVIQIPAGQTVRFNEYQAWLKLTDNDQASQRSRIGDRFTIWKDGMLRLQDRQIKRIHGD